MITLVSGIDQLLKCERTCYFNDMKSSTYLTSVLIGIMILVGTMLLTNRDLRAESPETLAETLHATYAAIDSMSFNFSQSTSGQMAGRDKRGKGNGLYASTDDQVWMRWNYITPDTQVVISDGQTISMYFKNLNQMIISEVDQAQTDILFAFFSAAEPLGNHFTILPPFLESDLTEEPTATLQVLRLQPLDKDSQIKDIHLWIGDDSIIRRIELLDYFDTKTIINLSNININPLDLSDRKDLEARFAFVPPEGTEIIRQ